MRQLHPGGEGGRRLAAVAELLPHVAVDDAAAREGPVRKLELEDADVRAPRGQLQPGGDLVQRVLRPRSLGDVLGHAHDAGHRARGIAQRRVVPLADDGASVPGDVLVHRVGGHVALPQAADDPGGPFPDLGCRQERGSFLSPDLLPPPAEGRLGRGVPFDDARPCIGHEARDGHPLELQAQALQQLVPLALEAQPGFFGLPVLRDVAPVERQAPVPDRVGVHPVPPAVRREEELDVNRHALGHGPAQGPVHLRPHHRREHFPDRLPQRASPRHAVPLLGRGVQVGQAPGAVDDHQPVRHRLDDVGDAVPELGLAPARPGPDYSRRRRRPREIRAAGRAVGPGRRGSCCLPAGFPAGPGLGSNGAFRSHRNRFLLGRFEPDRVVRMRCFAGPARSKCGAFVRSAITHPRGVSASDRVLRHGSTAGLRHAAERWAPALRPGWPGSRPRAMRMRIRR